MTIQAALPVPILAVTPVIAAVMILVLAAQRTIPVLMPVQPNAGQLVVTAIPHAQAEAPLIPVQSWVITNAAMPADLVQPLVRPALPPQIPEVAADQPRMNAEQKLVIILINPAVLILPMLTASTAALRLVLAVLLVNHAIPEMLARENIK